MFYLYLTAMLVFDLLGLSMAKLWQIHGLTRYLIICVIAYTVMAVFLALALKYEGAVITNVIWVALSAIGMTLIGFYIFKEPITILQFIGIGVIIVGLALIQWK